MLTLPPRQVDPSAPWPVPATRAATEYFFQNPETVAGMKLEVALTYLELGECKLAQQYLHEVLATFPDTQNRAMAYRYLYELSGGKEIIDLYPPSDRITELFTPEEEGG